MSLCDVYQQTLQKPSDLGGVAIIHQTKSECLDGLTLAVLCDRFDISVGMWAVVFAGKILILLSF